LLRPAARKKARAFSGLPAMSHLLLWPRVAAAAARASAEDRGACFSDGVGAGGVGADGVAAGGVRAGGAGAGEAGTDEVDRQLNIAATDVDGDFDGGVNVVGGDFGSIPVSTGSQAGSIPVSTGSQAGSIPVSTGSQAGAGFEAGVGAPPGFGVVSFSGDAFRGMEYGDFGSIPVSTGSQAGAGFEAGVGAPPGFGVVSFSGDAFRGMEYMVASRASPATSPELLIQAGLVDVFLLRLIELKFEPAADATLSPATGLPFARSPLP
jgi:hypothetical protein